MTSYYELNGGVIRGRGIEMILANYPIESDRPPSIYSFIPLLH